jgi:hypothetical protein
MRKMSIVYDDIVDELLKNFFVMAERANVGDKIVIRREGEVGGIDAGRVVEDVGDGAVDIFGNVVDVRDARNDAGDIDGIRSHMCISSVYLSILYEVVKNVNCYLTVTEER